MRVYQFRHVGLSCCRLAPLDVAAEFRYDSRLCRFALDQLSFRQRGHACFLRFRLGRFEETESIADAWQMSKPPDALLRTRADQPEHASRHRLGESPALRYTMGVKVSIQQAVAPTYTSHARVPAAGPAGLAQQDKKTRKRFEAPNSYHPQP